MAGGGSGLGQGGTGLPLPLTLGEGSSTAPGFAAPLPGAAAAAAFGGGGRVAGRIFALLGRVSIADGLLQLRAGWGCAGEPMRHGDAGCPLLRPGGHWGLQEKRCRFVVLGFVVVVARGCPQACGC